MAVFKCPFCKKKYVVKDALMDHLREEHDDELHNLPPEQIYFNYTNKYALTKENGISVISGKPTKFNLITCRYERFANEKERQQYRELFKERMKKVYGTDNLLTDPERQKQMLAKRHISGTYTWEDGTTSTFTGKLEEKFLSFLEHNLGWENPTDVFSPAPQIFRYLDPDGKEHFHIPDFYISSLNLIVNIKSADNKHYRLRDIQMEKAQDEEIKKSKFNYIKIYDNEISKFPGLIEQIKIKPEKRVFVESVYQYEEKNGLILND